jgi:hypothetical protein
VFSNLLPGSDSFVAVCSNVRIRCRGNVCLPRSVPRCQGNELAEHCLADGRIPAFRRHVTI